MQTAKIINSIIKGFSRAKFYNYIACPKNNDMQKKIIQIMQGLTISEQIAILEAITKKLRQDNSIMINAAQMANKKSVPERKNH
jgi:hypothetical protein